MSAAHPAVEQPGVNLGKYRLVAELGHGGMARVYLAIVRGPAGFNKLVVIKQIDTRLAGDPDFITMFLDEARLAARLNHPNVVQTNEVGQDGDRYFIAMEYLEGQPLNRIISRLSRPQKLTVAMQLRIIADVLVGLHYAHDLEDYDGTKLHVVHRDISPHNVFLTYDGQVKVVDFGIAKAMSSTSETRTGVLKGKVAYMSPEQARGDRVDRRADIYSVGVMLWEVATSRRLWKGLSDVNILHKLISGDIPTPRSLDASIPERLEAIVLKAIANDREKRYATALELQADLEKYLEDSGEKGSLREIGKLVAEAFAEEQVKVRALIEAQMKESRAERLPVIEAPHTSTSGSEVLSLDHGGDRREQSASGLRGPASGSGPHVSGSSLTASVASAQLLAPAPAPAGQSNVRFAIAAVAGVGIIVGALALMRGGAPAPGATPTAAPAPAASGARTLKIESTPPGAAVLENGRKVGTTPATITLEPTQTEQRTFIVTLDGYLPYAVNQGPSKEDVRIVAGLVPTAAVPAVATAQPSVTSTSASTGAAKPADPPRGRVAPPAPPPAKPAAPQSDIRMDR